MYNTITTNDDLLSQYITPALLAYFKDKLPELDVDRIKLQLSELLKYLTLAAHSPGPIPFTSEIDELWHLWILQTKEYQQLMLQLPSNKFIHHSAVEYAKHIEGGLTKDPKIAISTHINFLAAYVHNFGDFSVQVVEYWPPLNLLMTTLNTSLAGINAYLRAIKNVV